MYKLNQNRTSVFFVVVVVVKFCLFTLLLEFNDVIWLHVPLRIQLSSTKVI